MINENDIRFRFDAGKVKPFALDSATEDGLYQVGMGIDPKLKMDAYRMVAEDADPALQTSPSITVPQQFTQFWSPTAVEMLYTATMADEILGESIAGTWADTKYVVRWNEPLGQVSRYGDNNNVDFVGMNYNYEYRSVVRFQKGILPTRLAEEQASKARINLRADLMNAVSLAFNINQDNVAFYGYAPSIQTGATEPTYGILNEVGLSAYETLPNASGSASPAWSGKTWAEITADIRFLVGQLQTQLRGNFNPTRERFKFVFPLAVAQTLATTTEFGISVTKFIHDTYPNAEIIFAPKFDAADGGKNVCYVMAERVKGQLVGEQIIQQKMFLVGFEQTCYGKKELYSQATAGVVFRVPLGVVRASGL